MKAGKSADQASSRSSSVTPAATSTGDSGRKPWKKKSPVEVFNSQIERLRKEVQDKEEELKLAKRQLQKFEEAKKAFESA
jgi:hypothetical protein